MSNRVFDGDTLEAPPEGLSLSGCRVRGIRWEGSVFPRFFARGCVIESCDFRRARLENGYFGGGENAGFHQTLYRDCKFDEAVLDAMSFGTARFERCAFRDVRLRKWLSFSAEFIDCVFAGYMPEAAFLGRSPLRSAHGKRNEFRGNDFSRAKFGTVEFRGGVDLGLQRLPAGEGAVVLDRRTERIALVLARIESWADMAERSNAARYLRVYSGARYDGQEQLYLQDRPSRVIGDALRQRVIGMLTSCLPMERR